MEKARAQVLDQWAGERPDVYGSNEQDRSRMCMGRVEVQFLLCHVCSTMDLTESNQVTLICTHGAKTRMEIVVLPHQINPVTHVSRRKLQPD